MTTHDPVPMPYTVVEWAEVHKAEIDAMLVRGEAIIADFYDLSEARKACDALNRITAPMRSIDRDACAGCNIRGATHDPRCPTQTRDALLARLARSEGERDEARAEAVRWMDRYNKATIDLDAALRARGEG